MTKKQDELKDSNYDGIQEYDNDLPKWWVWLFYITIIWSGAYVAYLHLGSGKTPLQKLPEQLAEYEGMRKADAATADSGDESTRLLAMVSDAAVLKVGAEVYAGKCAACHNAQGQGLVGPNLTDDAWIHGGTITDIAYVIRKGVLEKGMLAWENVLTKAEVDAVTAYVWTLHGTNPPNAKAAEGVNVPRAQ